MKKVLPLLMMLLIGPIVASYAQECYQSTRSKGIGLYNKGKKAEAKRYFEAALDCPDKPANNDLDAWIRKCSSSSSSNPDQSSTGGKITVASVGFVDANSSSSLTRVGYYLEDLTTLSPKVTVENTNKSSKRAVVSLLVRDPEGNKVDFENENEFTESQNVTLKAGYTELSFSPIGDYIDDIPGTYTIQVWIGSNKEKEVSLEVFSHSTTLAVNGNTQSFEESVGCGSGVLSFRVNTNAGGFEIKHSPSWVTVQNYDNNSFTISFDANESSRQRSGKMDVCTIDGKKQININLVQEGDPNHKRSILVLKKIGINGSLPDFTSRASNELTSVVDYGVSDVSSMAYLEEPNYTTLGGFGFNFNVDIFLTNSFFIETGLGFNHYAVKNTFDNDMLLYGNKYNMDYGCVEKYRINSFQIPALAGFRLKVNSVQSVMFNVGLVAEIGLAAKCRLENGYSNYTLSNGNYANSTYSGYIDLYTGKFAIDQHYSTGQQPSYTYNGNKANPLKRFNMGLNLGASYDIGSVEFGIAYTIGLANIGNRNYFSSTDRVGGCLLGGDPIPSTQGVYGYSQHLNVLQFKVNIWL